MRAAARDDEKSRRVEHDTSACRHFGEATDPQPIFPPPRKTKGNA